MEEELIFCVVLIFKCIFELGFKLWTQSNDDLIDKFIVGWRFFMSGKKGYLSIARVKLCKSALTVNQTRDLQITGDVIFGVTLSQLSYQS